MDTRIFKNELSVLVSGEAGQGLQSIEKIMAQLVKSNGYNVFTYSEFMSRIRGGNNTTELRISSEKVSSYLERIDLFIPLSKGAIERVENRINEGTVIISDPDYIEDKYKNSIYRIIEMPLNTYMKDLGDNIYINTVIIGFLATLLSISYDSASETISDKFKNLPEDIKNKNIEALKTGYEFGNEKIASGVLSVEINKDESIKNDLILYGNEAVGLGAVTGGCNFISSYPMSPSTGVLVYLAQNADNLGIIVEQAEDEISAINMGLGAWYAGARAMVTTSGGGFALMTEGLSLAGAIESPIVIHIAQRPGPATGLPTRTEQGDFMMALYSGHGDFPRIILTPGDKEEGIKLTHHAFNIADKYQVPVLILTDQYFMDSSVNIKDFGISRLEKADYLEETGDDYSRYKITENGVSPRGVPGYGSGIVCVDSDEHDEHGYITEDFNIRTKMVNKRLSKYNYIKNDVIPPEFSGSEHYKYIIISWGSNKQAVREALFNFNRDDIAFLSYSQLYPLYDRTEEMLLKADEKIIIENNATAQFGNFIRQETGIEFDHKITKYNGMPFTVEEIINKLKKII